MNKIALFPYTTLPQEDPDVATAIVSELKRQQNQLEMIASENFTSLAVIQATGSVLTNKYAEGYPGRRYYGGCEHVDTVENLAIQRACQLFSCQFANVQPHSGAQANEAVFLALLTPGDTILGMSLDSGGHLTHGAKVNMSGKWFHATSYGVDEKGHINMSEVAEQARTHKPKLIIAGGSAYSRIIDFAKFRAIADEVGAYLMVDMAHFAGLVAGGTYPSPLPHAHIVTTTTHKTLRGPRGGMILTNEPDLAKKIDTAVFPGNQGGPLMHVIAGKAVALKEALRPEFKTYAQAIVKNAQALASSLQEQGIVIFSGGTDSHLLLIDLRPFDLTGRQITHSLENAGITCNKNSIPRDTRSSVETSGIRLGTPALTTRGLKLEDFKTIGHWVTQVILANKESPAKAQTVEKEIRDKVSQLCQRYPLYPELVA